MKRRLLLAILLLIPATVQPQSPLVSVSVTVLVEGASVVPAFSMAFEHRAGARRFGVPMDTGFGNAFMVLSVSEADRVFNVPVPEGDCRVTWSSLPDNYSVQSIVAGPSDLRKSLLTVSRDATPRVVVTLKVKDLPGSAVRGTVSGLPPQVSSARPPVALMGENLLISTRMKADGSFELAHVPPGYYVARVARTLGVQPSSATNVTVNRQDVNNVRIDMPPLKEVRGRVIVEGIGPLRQVLFQVSGGPLASRNVTGLIPLGTDGTFRILLPEGNCLIALVTAQLPVGYTLRSLQYGSTDLLANNSAMITRDNTAELRAIVAVTTVGITLKTTDGSEMAIPEASNAWVRVRGRVSGILPGDSRLVLSMHSEQARVIATGARGLTLQGGGASAVTTLMNFDGSFEFPKVTQGRYMLSAAIPGFVAYRSMEVAEKDVNDIEIVIPPRKTVTGRVVVEGGGLLPRGYGFTLRGADGGGFLVWQTPGCNGSFLTALPEGDYLVSTALPAGYVTALTYGSTNLLRDRLKVSPDDDAELRITFAATSTAGSGVVGGAFFGLSNFSGLENGLPGPLSPPLGARGAAFLGGGGFATDTPTLGCVFIAGGNATEVPDLRLRFSGASSVEIPVMPDGTFRTTLPKGEYRLTLSALPKGYVLRSIKLGTADLRREAFNIDDTQAFILVVLDPIS